MKKYILMINSLIRSIMNFILFIHIFVTKRKNLKTFKTKIKNFSFVSGIFKENLMDCNFTLRKAG